MKRDRQRLIAWAAVTGYLLATAFVLPRLLPACPLHALTGLYCPGCGGTRAMQALAHGHLRQAISYNLLLLPMLPVVSLLFADQVLFHVRGRRLIPLRLHATLAWLTLGAVAAYSLARNLPFTACDWLRPHGL